MTISSNWAVGGGSNMTGANAEDFVVKVDTFSLGLSLRHLTATRFFLAGFLMTLSGAMFLSCLIDLLVRSMSNWAVGGGSNMTGANAEEVVVKVSTSFSRLPS